MVDNNELIFNHYLTIITKLSIKPTQSKFMLIKLLIKKSVSDLKPRAIISFEYISCLILGTITYFEFI